MTPIERRAIFSLSSIMGLRMMGLFMVLPLFTLYASTLTGATPALVGLGMGIYGLAQACCQIPFGSLSDRIDRKLVITLGLIIFIAGSLLASIAHSIALMIIARTLQGMGAIGSTVLALLADLTQEKERTKAMAISGMTIGLSFAIAMLLGPWLHQWLSVSTLFLLSAGFGAIAIALLYLTVPTPIVHEWHGDTEPEFHSVMTLLFKPTLAKLNIGIFMLHAIFTASFIVIPLSLLHNMNMPSHEQWHIYLPALIIAFTLSMICIGVAEAKRIVHPFFLASIITLFFAEIVLLFSHTHVLFFATGVCLFFAGFTLLEAFLPSLISRSAPPAQKGSAMGIYSSAQFLGIFVGGALGGWLFGHLGLTSVYLFSIVLALVWFLLVIFI